MVETLNWEDILIFFCCIFWLLIFFLCLGPFLVWFTEESDTEANPNSTSKLLNIPIRRHHQT